MVTERGAIVMTKSKANRSTGDAVPHITSDPIEDGAAANRSIALNPFAPLAFARCLTEKSLVKIGVSSRTTRIASKRGEFSPNRSQSGYLVRVV
jgi:hypothetical protein